MKTFFAITAVLVSFTLSTHEAVASQKICLSDAEITQALQQLAAESGYPHKIKFTDSVSIISGSFPIAALFAEIDNQKSLRKAGLSLTPGEIAYASTIGELGGVIKWSLCRR